MRNGPILIPRNQSPSAWMHKSGEWCITTSKKNLMLATTPRQAEDYPHPLFSDPLNCHIGNSTPIAAAVKDAEKCE